MITFKCGDTVKLKPRTVRLPNPDGSNHYTAEIQGFYSDIEGGVFLDRHLGGFWSWNVEDLLPAKTSSRNPPA